MDPAGTAPIFVALTRRMDARQRRWAAVRAMGAAGALARQRPEGAVLAGAVAALIAMTVALLLAGAIARFIPRQFLHFLTRVFGLLLAGIAVQLVADGIRALTGA